jgi:hypothetical protein
MNKILIIIFILIFGYVNKAYSNEACHKLTQFSWRYVDVAGTHVKKEKAFEARFNFKSISSDEIKINRLLFYTSDGKVVRDKVVNLYIKPFGKSSASFYVGDINLDVVSTASYSCRYESEISKYNSNNKLEKKANYSRDNTQNDLKNYWWVLIILALISYLVYTQTAKNVASRNKSKVMKPVAQEKSQNIFIRFFRGGLSLPISYWLWLGGIGAAMNLSYIFMEKNRTSDDVVGLISLFFIAIYVYLYIGTWRSAENYKKEKIKNKLGYGWAIAAQVFMVLGIIRFVLEIVKEFK